ncbi:unnamed protein product [Hermetia illucens]|uniref:SCP domain-containing protein n=1 Tax=Hermetia illucens TaxID=343691 RepID=A0A7R8UED8_HERIL|nr:unnamed protein product [Hermetia illucens]
MTKKLRNSIISVHNEYRNELSCGLVEDVNKIPFPPAAKMRELKWDNELEYLAGLHVQHCTVAQDECRITSRFKLVGQNVGAIIGCVPNIGGLQIGAATNEILRQWFNEHLGATYRSSDEFQSEPQTDQFFQMINDKTARVGCALALCSFNTTDNILLLTCNYSYKTVNDEAVYTAGAIVTKCDRANSRPSANYRCLCDLDNINLIKRSQPNKAKRLQKKII